MRMPHTKPPPPPSPQLPITLPEAEPGSLRYILVTNSSKRLYLHPELWTKEILTLLGCTYDILPAGESQPAIPYDSFNQHGAYRMAARVHCQMVHTYLPQDRDKTLRALIPPFFNLLQDQLRYHPKPNFSGLPFYFGQKRVARVYCPWLVHDLKKRRPVCAFIDKAWLRHNEARFFPRRASMKKRGRVNPGCNEPSSLIEPYFVAIMIAIAQNSRSRYLVEEETRSRKVFLLTPSEDQKSLTLYTAYINPRFLKKLDFPYQNFTSTLRITSQKLESEDLEVCCGEFKMLLKTIRERAAVAPFQSAQANVQTSTLATELEVDGLCPMPKRRRISTSDTD